MVNSSRKIRECFLSESIGQSACRIISWREKVNYLTSNVIYFVYFQLDWKKYRPLHAQKGSEELFFSENWIILYLHYEQKHTSRHTLSFLAIPLLCLGMLFVQKDDPRRRWPQNVTMEMTRAGCHGGHVGGHTTCTAQPLPLWYFSKSLSREETDWSFGYFRVSCCHTQSSMWGHYIQSLLMVF